jgi:hypothetical protein
MPVINAFFIFLNSSTILIFYTLKLFKLFIPFLLPHRQSPRILLWLGRISFLSQIGWDILIVFLFLINPDYEIDSNPFNLTIDQSTDLPIKLKTISQSKTIYRSTNLPICDQSIKYNFYLPMK